MPPTARVLLICPDRATAERLAAVVSRHGTVAATSSVRLATERGGTIDLVVLARALDAGSYEAVLTLRGAAGFEDVPLLAVNTGGVDEMVRLIEGGADDVVARDCHPAELSARVDALLRRRARSAPATAREVGRPQARAQPGAIEARGLRKAYGTTTAVDGIDFDVAAGEAFGFLGPNGAGKTSTMRMISTVSPLSGGRLRVLGMDPVTDGPAIRARIGVVPQQDALDAELTVEENLVIFGRYFDRPWGRARARARELLDFMQLGERGADEVDSLSGGMKRRLSIARSLVNEPDLVLLDEPTTGLDPQARHLLWERLYQLKEQGVTLVLTTHYMDEAEQLCDRLVVMDRGRIVAVGTPSDLIRSYATREVLELRFAPRDRAALNGHLEGIADRVEHLPDRVLLYTRDGEAAAAAVHGRGLAPESTLVRRASLEDVFLRLTGRSLVD